ncbi:unnamed protein product, partial [Dovyalis caffra]
MVITHPSPSNHPPPFSSYNFVEHLVTKWIARNKSPADLGRSGDRYSSLANSGKTSLVATLFYFDRVESIKPKGHCVYVVVRVTSEDPDDGFKPIRGKVK